MAHRQVFLALLLVACGETASEPVPAPDAPVCYEIGFATQLPHGAIVPVLNDASISNGFACSGCVGGHCRVRCLDTSGCPSGSVCEELEQHVSYCKTPSDAATD